LQKFRLIDLYAGIGGIRLGFEQAFGNSARFVFSNEINKNSCATYEANFGKNPSGDITKIRTSDIPDFDILLAGFPCQAFSIAGKQNGFADIRGTHFFEIARIIRDKKPLAFLLENVKHFQNHDKGRTFSTVKKTIEDDLGYTFYYSTLNAADFGLAQKRQRVFMVGFREPISFEFPKPMVKLTEGPCVRTILENDVEGHFFLSQKYLDTLKKHRKRHEEKNHGFGYVVLDKDGLANTLVLGGMGTERNLISDKDSLRKSGRTDANSEAIRSLTPREALRLQGFPESFKIAVPKTSMFDQAANSVPVPVVKVVAFQMLKALEEKKPAPTMMPYIK